MKEEIKEIWIDALTSGEYKQCRGHLRMRDGYCCLGVLNDLYLKETGDGEWDKKYSEFESKTDLSTTGLTDDVVRWAAIPDYIGSYKKRSLMFDNDTGKSFMEIAEIIFENF